MILITLSVPIVDTSMNIEKIISAIISLFIPLLFQIHITQKNKLLYFDFVFNAIVSKKSFFRQDSNSKNH